jgi:membrane protease YdiL (CAAX protease family)
MEKFVRGVSPRAEFFFVVSLAFGYFILGSMLSIFQPDTNAQIQEGGLEFLLFYELFIALILVIFLLLRGWRPQHVGLMGSARDLLLGVALTAVSYLVLIALWQMVSAIGPGVVNDTDSLVKPDLSLATVLLVSTINPLFEEIFVCGYVISALARTRGLSFAINVSMAVRLAYHLYQGTAGVVNIIPLGFIFAYWYARTGRLWPVIVAHALFDFLALVSYVAK